MYQEHRHLFYKYTAARFEIASIKEFRIHDLRVPLSTKPPQKRPRMCEAPGIPAKANIKPNPKSFALKHW